MNEKEIEYLSSDSDEERDFSEEISLPIRWGDYSSEEEKSDTDEPRNINFSLPNSDDLYCFFLWASDMNRFIFNDISEVLEGYRYFCHSIGHYNQQLNMKGIMPDSDLIKDCFKLRHNVFSAIFLSSIGVRVQQIDTDMSLRDLGIDSNKTPDYIFFHTQEKISILEFTVSTKWENVLYNKGGGILDLKYTKEAEALRENGYEVTLHIIPAVLGEENISGIVEKARLLYPEVDADLLLLRLTDFFRISRKTLSSMNSLFQYHIRNSDSSISQFQEAATFLEDQISREYDMHETEDDTIVFCFEADVISFLVNQRIKTANIISRALIGRAKTENISLFLDLSGNRYMLKWRENKKGLDPVEMVAVLTKGSLSSILSILTVEKSGKNVGFKEISGTVPVTIKMSYQEGSHHHPLTFTTNLPFNLYSKSDKSRFMPKNIERLKTIVPPNYRDVLLEKLDHVTLADKDVDNKMIANNPINDRHIEHSIKTFREHYSKHRFNEEAIHSPKPTFIYPITDNEIRFVKTDVVNSTFSSSLIGKGLGGYTDEILRRYSESKFARTKVYEMSKEDQEAQSKMGKAHTEFCQELIGYKDQARRDVILAVKRNKRPEDFDEELFSKLRVGYSKIEDANKAYKERIKEKIPIRTNLVMLRSGKNSNNRRFFEDEMSHFDHTGKQYKGVDPNQTSLSEVNQMFRHDFKDFLNPSFNKLNIKMFNTQRKPDEKFLMDLKNQMQDGWTELSEQLLKTPLFHSLYLTQNLCKTLFKESCKSYNSDYVHCDNLGISDVLLLVRGGPKIYSKNMSKLYRLIWPLSSAYQRMTGYEDNQNYKILRIHELDYVVTPWSQMHPDVIYDGMSIIPRIFSYLNSLHLNNNYKDISDFNEFDLLPVILGLSNRRKTEQFMHNMRYLIVNPIGSYSNINDIMSSFAGFNYTFLDYFLRENLSTNYINFASNIQRLNLMPKGKVNSSLNNIQLRCMFTDVSISTSTQLVNSIYSTYLMTKAPVDSKLEQIVNLWPILDDVLKFETDHSDVEYMVDKSLRFSLMDNDPSSYKDDFKYDPIFCQELGNYASQFLKRNVGFVQLDNMWKSCMNTGFDKIANPNGLRGWNKKNFFNKKGYEVVYEYISTVMEEDLSEVLDEYQSMSHSETVERLNQDKFTFLKYYQMRERKNEEILQKATFHVVDKLQRGGGREIFVMDIFTKAVQYPVEKFLSKVSQKIPNEFISIPANKRSSIIHSIFFEKKLGRWVKEICRWVLDCRRWAPHSVFQKYVHFVVGMKKVLPVGFYNQFMYLSKKMMEKQFIVKTPIVNSMMKNQRIEPYKKFLSLSNQPVDVYKIDVKFSFVMGIFNYLSSMMHAFNQMYASELIRDYNLKRDYGLVILRMNAHSDDSAGESQHESEKSIKPTIILYDWLLKGANHMLSIKKSQINRNQYFEFLSVLYLKNELLPVSPKFVGSLPFKPSDNGYPSDITYPVSKSMEMYFNGCSINESFLMLKLAEKYIQGLYQIDDPTNLNPQFFGGVDSFPIDYMIGGPMTEVYKDMKYNMKSFSIASEYMIKLDLMGRPTDGVKWDMNARLPMGNTFHENVIIPELLSKSWFMENCKTNDPVLNIIWYTNKLRDRKYLASLTSEPDSRRYSRIFGSFLNRYLQRIDGSKIKATEVYSGIRVALEELEPSSTNVDISLFKQLTGELNDYLESFEDIELSTKVWYTSEKTAKPVFFSANYTEFGTISNISPSEYTVYRHEPSFYRFFGKRADLTKSFKLLDSVFEGMGLMDLSPEETFKLVSKLTGRDNKRYNYINHMPTEMRSIQNHEGYALSLIETLHPHMKFDISLRKQKTADYRKTFERKGIPEPLHDIMKVKNAIKFFEVWDVSSEDIFKVDLKNEFDSLLTRVETDWVPFIYNEYKDSSLLQENYYFYIWTKEQSKFGRDWIGDGSLLVNLPEGPVCFEVLNNQVEKITFNDDHIEFSKMSSWFLTSVVDRELRIRNQLVDSDTVPSEKVVFGYNLKKKIWGVGHAFTLDMIFECTEIDDNEKFNLLYHQGTFKINDSGKNIVSISGKKDYVIKKAWELEFDKFTDVTSFLDPAKLRKNRNPKVKSMCHACAIDLLGKIPYNPETVKRNIGQTKLYRVMYDYPKLQDIMSSETGVEDSMISILSHQKAMDSKFEFPSSEDLIKISKNPWTGKLPSNIQKYVTKMGNKALTDDELLYIYNLLKNISEEDEDRVFSELRMIYGDTTAVQGIVLNIVRDTRLLTMCVQMPPQGRICSIHDDIHSLCCKLINDNLSYSEILNGIVRRCSRDIKTKVIPENLFKMLYSRAIVGCVFTVRPDHVGLKSANTVIGIITELFENANQAILNNYRFKTDLLRTTDFFSDFEATKNWICDIFDCICQVHWRLKEMKPSLLASNLTNFGTVAAEISKNSLYGEDYIEVLMPKRKQTQKFTVTKNHMSGPCVEQFKPLSEDMMMEFESSIGLDECPEEEAGISEDEEEPEPIPWIAYTQKNLYTIDDVRRIRGTAWNVFCGTNSVTRSVMSVFNSVLYKRDNFKNTRDWVSTEFTYVIGFLFGKKRIKLKGYTAVDWQNQEHEMNYRQFENPYFYLDDGKLLKSAIFNDPFAMSNANHKIKALWGRIKQDQMGDFENKVKRIVRKLDTGEIEQNKQIIDRIDSLRKIVRNEEGEPGGEITNEDYKSLIGNLISTVLGTENIKALAEGAESQKRTEIRITEKILKDRPSNFRVDKNISVVNDIRLRSEMESLVPGITEGMMTGEMKLTRKSKKQVLKIAENSIKVCTNPVEKKKLSRLLVIVKCMLGSIEETLNSSTEDHALFHNLSSLFLYEEEEDIGEMISLYNLPPEEESIEFMMDYQEIT